MSASVRQMTRRDFDREADYHQSPCQTDSSPSNRLDADEQDDEDQFRRRTEQCRRSLDLCRRLPPKVRGRILLEVELKQRTRLESVSRAWRRAILATDKMERRPVWLYLIFRKNHISGHKRPTVHISCEGPFFWHKLVVYVYCCSCHYTDHEASLFGLFDRLCHRVVRLCMVDSPIQYPFLPDSFFAYLWRFVRLEFAYLRQLDLEWLQYVTVKHIAQHANLKRLVVHSCNKIDVLQEFGGLPQLLIVKGEIQGLKQLLAGVSFDEDEWNSLPERPIVPSTAELPKSLAQIELEQLPDKDEPAGPSAANGPVSRLDGLDVINAKMLELLDEEDPNPTPPPER